jgi:hypothetical protein
MNAQYPTLNFQFSSELINLDIGYSVLVIGYSELRPCEFSGRMPVLH